MGFVILGGAGAPITGTAPKPHAEHLIRVAVWTGVLGGGRAEQGDDRCSNSDRHVHRAGVRREHDPGPTEHCGEGLEGGPAIDAEGGTLQQGEDGIEIRAITGRSGKHGWQPGCVE